MLAAAMPFPSEETTPPVTKMYLAMNQSREASNELRDTFEVLGRVHAQRFVFGFDHPNGIAVFQRAQLLQPLRLFERTDGQIGVAKQKIPPIDIQTDVLESRHD